MLVKLLAQPRSHLLQLLVVGILLVPSACKPISARKDIPLDDPVRGLRLGRDIGQQKHLSSNDLLSNSTTSGCKLKAGVATCGDCVDLLMEGDLFRNAFKLSLEGATCSLPVSSVLLAVPGLLVSNYCTRHWYFCSE